MSHASTSGRGAERTASRPESSSRPSLLRNPFRRGAADGSRATGRAYTESFDRGRAGAFGLGLALGALAGAGVALLMAPQSGYETRSRLVDGARDVRGRAADSWDDLTESVRDVARRNRKRLRRGVVRGRWAAEDIYDGSHRGRNRQRAEVDED